MVNYWKKNFYRNFFFYRGPKLLFLFLSAVWFDLSLWVLINYKTPLSNQTIVIIPTIICLMNTKQCINEKKSGGKGEAEAFFFDISPNVPWRDTKKVGSEQVGLWSRIKMYSSHLTWIIYANYLLKKNAVKNLFFGIF